jgi:aryl-alcohol dehydrogenase
MKMSGRRPDGSTLHAQNGAPIFGAFFQQSSFGNFAIANAKFAVKVPRNAPIELLGPLACGGQTGAGAVLNVMRPAPGDSFGVFGVGSVGLSGLMAAKIAGCDPIIAVDVHAHRLALARELGATHTIDHAGRTDVVAEIRKITGHGLRFSLETSAQPAVLREAIEALMPAGMCVLLGSARAGTALTVGLFKSGMKDCPEARAHRISSTDLGRGLALRPRAGVLQPRKRFCFQERRGQ